MHRFRLLLIASLGLFILGGCEKKDANQPPQGSSSVDHVGYAESYPDEVESASGDIEKGKSTVADKTAEFGSYPGQLKEPTDYDVSIEVIKAADESGRSQAYVERARENETVFKILDENNGQVIKKVAGAVQYTAQQKGCDAEMGSVAAGAMKVTLKKRTEERLRERNRAYEIIERNEEKLGKSNVATLQKQSDDIAQASYVAFIQLPTRRSELNRLVRERGDVARTIDRQIEEENRFQAQDGVSDKAKKASQARVTQLEESKTKLEASEQYDSKQLEQLDKDIKATQDSYREAFDKLIDDLKAKGGGAPASEPDPGGASVEVNAG